MIAQNEWRRAKKVMFPLAIVSLCLLGYVAHRESSIFREFEAALLSVQWMVLVCIAFWCSSFIFLTFSGNDLPLIGLLLIVISTYFIGYAAVLPTTDAIIFLAGVTLARGTRFFLKSRNQSETPNVVSYFLMGLVVLLAFSSWWRLDVTDNFYHGLRWTGLYNNPNIYGILMGAGLLLALGLLASNEKSESGKRKAKTIFLFIAAGMMGIGLLFSYSRGAWFGTAIGLLYLAKAYGKFKWQFVLPGFFFAAVVICFFWNSTPDTSSWYMKRMDLSRPSAQHRVAAWKAGFEMMRDHPFGVGWNKAVGVYGEKYSPPPNGVDAITTNDYLMMGTQLGLLGLLCFVAYIYLKFKSKAADSLQVACRAGALVLLVAFWFDGGLFTLATASVFWILLELGTSDLAVNRNRLKTQCFPSQPA